MELLYKPDFERARAYWRAFWEGAVLDRPCVMVTAPLQPAHPIKRPPILTRAGGDYLGTLHRFEHWAANTYFAGEAMPSVDTWFGPDQFAAFMGAALSYAEDDETSWTTPCVTDWRAAELRLDETPGSVWTELLAFARLAAQRSQGKYLVSTLDMHTNLDALRGLRGTQELCFDLMDCPDDVECALDQVRALYAPVYEAVYAAGDMQRGTTSWLPSYCEQRYAVVECDVICLLGRAHARRFVLPAIAEEAAYLDHCIYHYDGPQALRHLDDILAVPDFDVIQWVPGDGQPRTVAWMDLLQKIQAAGKGLWLGDWTIDDIHQHYHELRPEGLCFYLTVDTPQAADDLLAWLKAHT
jgi:hypothetical protein